MPSVSKEPIGAFGPTLPTGGEAYLSPPTLGASYSDALLALLREVHLPIRYVSVTQGLWMSETPEEMVARVSGLTPLYHQTELVWADGAEREAALVALQRWERAGCPWMSTHISCYARAQIYALLNERRELPECGAAEALRLIEEGVRSIRERIAVPVLLENMPALHGHLAEAGHSLDQLEMTVWPDFVRRALERTGCDLLLDLPHARIAAEALGQAVEEYLSQFPLERVIEIHTSGPRLREGRLFDSHEPLQDTDYDLLEWAARHTRPRVVTLEYWKEATLLHEQLARMNDIIERVYGGRARSQETGV